MGFWKPHLPTRRARHGNDAGKMMPNESLTKLLDIMAQLRDPKNGCPWDIQQNFATIAPYTIEEAYEVVDAINRDNMSDLREELGDLLLQVVFHAQMAKEGGHFDFTDIVQGLNAKLIRRHPHVFANETAHNAQDVGQIWQKAKSLENKTNPTPITQMFSALMQAQKISVRAAKLGFEWDKISDIVSKLHEEIAEYEQAVANEDDKNIAEELGDLLFTIVQLIRRHHLSAEIVMLNTNKKFQNRMDIMQENIAKDNKIADNLTPDEWEYYWQLAKANNTL